MTTETARDPLDPHPLSPQEIHNQRRDLRLTEAQFGAALSVSARTVRAWEAGKRQPRHPHMVDLAIKALGMAKVTRSIQAATADRKAGIDRGPCAPWRFGD
jgi:hypothetical protein